MFPGGNSASHAEGEKFPRVNLHLKVHPLSQSYQHLGILSLQAYDGKKHINFSHEKHMDFLWLFGHNYSMFRQQKVQLNNEHAFAFPCFSSHQSGQQGRLQKPLS